MKLKNGWVISEIDGEYVVVPTGESADGFCGVVHLNETGKDIWQGLTKGLGEKEIAVKLTELYDGVTLEKALDSVCKVINELKKEGILSE